MQQLEGRVKGGGGACPGSSLAADTQGTLLGTCGCSGLDHQGGDAKKVKKHVVRLERSVEVGEAIHPWLRRGVRWHRCGQRAPWYHGINNLPQYDYV